MENKKPDLDNLDESLFKIVEQEGKQYDKKFETKPIGYFKDAMIRFGKNRANVVATIILFTLISISIIVPITTTKNFTRQENHVRHLPPRVPIVERWGIMDGVVFHENVTVDADTIVYDDAGNAIFGLPAMHRFHHDYIFQDTVSVATTPCTTRASYCYGGVNVMFFERQNTDYYILSTLTEDPDFIPGIGDDDDDDDDDLLAGEHRITFDPAVNPKLTVVIDEMSIGDNTRLLVKVSTDGLPHGQDKVYETVLEISAAGTHEIDVFDALAHHEKFESRLKIQMVSNTRTAFVAIESITVSTDADEDEPKHDFRGYELSLFERGLDRQDDGRAKGRFERRHAELMTASFRFDLYGARFLGPFHRDNMNHETFSELIDRDPENCAERLPHPYDPDGEDMDRMWAYEEGCPIVAVNNYRENTYVRQGQTITTRQYNVTVENYMVFRNLDSVPYYLFGTTGTGFDLFAIVWLGLRTSLTIGLIVGVINISAGIVYGAISGYYGGKVDILMERFSEIVGRVPWLVWLSIFVALIGPGVLTLILILTVSGWIGVSSVTRTQFYRYKGREYVLSSRTLGAKDSRLIFRHILPNGIGTIITSSILMIPFVIFSEASISYLGFGIGHGQSFSLFGLIELSGVSIGVLLADGRNEMMTRPYLTVFPAVIISILMITFNMFGNALRDAFNPTLRGTQE